MVSTRHGATILHHLLQLRRHNIDCKFPGLLDELVGITGGAYQHHEDGSSPDDSCRSPSDRHNIRKTFLPTADKKHSVFAKSFYRLLNMVPIISDLFCHD